MKKETIALKLDCIIALKKDIAETRRDILWIKDSLELLTGLSNETNQHLSEIRIENVQQTTGLRTLKPKYI